MKPFNGTHVQPKPSSIRVRLGPNLRRFEKTARSSEYRGGRSILSSFLRWRLLLNKKKLLLKKSLASGFILSTRLTRGKCKDVTRRRRARSILKRSSVVCSRQGLILSRPMGVVEYEVTRCSRYGYTVLRITLRYARNLNVRFVKVRKEKGFLSSLVVESTGQFGNPCPGLLACPPQCKRPTQWQ